MQGRLGIVAGAAGTVAVVVVVTTVAGKSSPPVASLSRPHVSVSAGQVSVADLQGFHWDVLPDAPIAVRDAAVSVWTGTRMIVWGGVSRDGRRLGDGASYDPMTRTWEKLPPSPLGARASAAYAWTGRELFIWGGRSASGKIDPTGALYDPASRTWQQLPPLDVQTAFSSTAVWTGTDIVLFTNGSLATSVQVHSYDPQTDSWSELPGLTITQTNLFGVAALVAGDQLYIWLPVQTIDNGLTTDNLGFVYRPASNTWQPTELLPTANGFGVGATIWTGDHVIFGPATVACTCGGKGGWSTGTWADPATGQETAIPRLPDGPFGPVEASSYEWTGGAILATGPNALVAAWDPNTRSWTALSDMPYDGAGVQLWTGTELIVWGQFYTRVTKPNVSSHPVDEPTGLEFRP